jgi:hypothetical protein
VREGSGENEPTTEDLLREGDELLDSSHALLRDLDRRLRGDDADDPPAAGEPPR